MDIATQLSRPPCPPASRATLVDLVALQRAYYSDRPDPSLPAQRVVFGTSGHRGSALDRSFNEWHVMAITQAICHERLHAGVTGPLFLGCDTHALSAPACATALEVLAANGVHVMLAAHDEFTPTPVISHAILAHNRSLQGGWADGIVMTPSHNPPRDGGLKYNPPHGGPAGTQVTARIEAAANRYLETRLDGVISLPQARALRASTTHRHDYLDAYVGDLGSVVDMALIRDTKIRIGVDPMGGAGVHYWPAIAERHGLDLSVVNDIVDPRFAFMPLDHDGLIRMDPSSPCAMQNLVALKDRFDIALACDTDHDRHGIVTPAVGLLPSNHYLAVAVDYLLRNRPQWHPRCGVGKSVVTTMLIDRIAARLGRRVVDMPVGFKWFVDGLASGQLGFAGEESAGASFLRRDGSVWTTDKDGITAALLAAEITARSNCDPGMLYEALAEELGRPAARRLQAPATAPQRQRLATLTPQEIDCTELAGEPVTAILDRAPGNGQALGGIKVVSANGWFAARPSGTEAVYKIYAETLDGPARLQQILAEAQTVVDTALGCPALGSATGCPALVVATAESEH